MSSLSTPKSDCGLSGQGVLVTGAAGGIGSAVVAQFLEVGADVYAVDKDQTRLDALARESNGPGKLHVRQFDLLDTAGLDGLVKDASQALPGLDVLAHTAALLIRKPITDVSIQDWELQIGVNLRATYFLNRAAAEVMKRRRYGRIINFSSTVWATGTDAAADVYAISKGAVITLTRNFAKSYGPYGILVNAVTPGQIDTDMQRAGNTPEAIESGLARCPLGRMGRVDEVAGAVLFLASQHASFVSGTTVTVAGGATLW